jgi:hypothetical protein
MAGSLGKEIGLSSLRERVPEEGMASAVPFGASPGLLVRGSGFLNPRNNPAYKLRASALAAAFYSC